MQVLTEIKDMLIAGKHKIVAELCGNAVADGIAPDQILNALLDGMGVVGTRFKNNEIFVPEVLIAARSLNYGLEVIKPLLQASGVQPVGRAVIGTVQGDLHDIGKNLVKMMLVGAGFDVVDVGVDVSAEKFVDAAVEANADVICLSALLTTTMNSMKGVIDLLNERGLRDRFIVMIGGAPVTESFCREIGADAYTADAASAAEVAKKLVTGK